MKATDTIQKLMEVMTYDLDRVCTNCQESEGTQGCDEANELQHVIEFIQKYLTQ